MIKSDLNYAEQHLPWTNTPGRVNLAMAKHINAKVSMWNQDWQGAINKTEDIFNSGFYSLMDNPADIFDGINNYGLVKKQQLPTKICVTCGLEFTWRKKWKKNWDEVKYCSKLCRSKR